MRWVPQWFHLILLHLGTPNRILSQETLGDPHESDPFQVGSSGVRRRMASKWDHHLKPSRPAYDVEGHSSLLTRRRQLQRYGWVVILLVAQLLEGVGLAHVVGK